MLPDRSKRFASADVDGDLPRLKLAENWQLAVIAFIMLGLFVVIFPRKAIVEKLYTQSSLDELTLSYIENLQRTEPDNVDLAILLGRLRHDRLEVAATESLLLPVIANGDAKQRLEARRLLLDIYQRELSGHPSDAAAAHLKSSIIALLEAARREEVPSDKAGELAFSAFRVEQPALGLDFLKRVATNNARGNEVATHVLVANAREALGLGHHALAAEYFLLAREQVGDRATARNLYKQGIGALMAASLFPQAMQAAESKLGDLADDPDTLRYLMRTALAAGDPRRAALYARRLMFGEGDGRAGGER